MLDFLKLKTESFGLDISEFSIKIVKLRKKGKFLTLDSFGEQKIKEGIIKGGEIKNEEKLAEVIKSAIRNVEGKKIKTKYVIVSLPEEKSFLEVIQMPKIPKEDLRSAVIFESENYIPLPIERVYLDFEVIPPVYDHLDHLDVLITAFPRRILDSYLSCLKLAGLQPLAFEIESEAIARALVKNKTTNHPLVLIDLGASRTDFIIFAGHSIRFTSSISVSSNYFSQVISKNFGVKLSEAEILKRKYGLEKKLELKMASENKKVKIKKEKGKIFESLIPGLVDLVQQIKVHLRYYQTHSLHNYLPPDGNKFSKILLCGGGANLKGLPEFLSLELKLPVELGDPWTNILRDKKEKSKLPLEKSLAYTTAIGLAFRGIEINNKKSNI